MLIKKKRSLAFKQFITSATILNFIVSTSAFAEEQAPADSGASGSSVVSEAINKQEVGVVDDNLEESDSSNEADSKLDAVVVKRKRVKTVLPKRPSASVYGTDTSVLDTSRSVSQISEEQLQRDPIKTADDLVKYAPGITRNGGQNVSIAPLIRGQNSEIFQDGQRTYNVRHPFNLNAFEAVDIVAGPPSQVFGPSSRSGGYANYISKKPDFDKQRNQVNVQLGTLIPSGDSYFSGKVTYDTTGPINDKVAYRVSITPQRSNDYYKNISNDFNSVYGALAFKPTDDVRIDWNASYDDYYDFNVTHGWNRATQELIDNGKYYAGRATPIISKVVGGVTQYFSPVYANGSPNSQVVSWQQRTRNAQGQFIAGATVAAPFTTPGQAGTVRGWVYDPTLAGNGLTSLSRSDFSNPNDENTAKRGTSQLRVAVDLSKNWSILNSSFFQYSKDTTDSVGSFLAQFEDKIFDNRFELRGKTNFDLFGLDIQDNSNTGVSIRHERFKSLAANNSFTVAPYDLTAPLSLKSPAGLYGLPVPGGSGSWIGTAGVPQLSSYFGYLNLPRMYPAGDGLYSEVGGSPASGGAVYTGEGNWTTTSIFTQQNISINKRLGFNLGLNSTHINAKIKNPLVITPDQERSDEQNFVLPSVQASVYVKPLENTTIYYTYDRSYALNTGGFADVLTWAPSGNTLNPLAFESLSELRELGIKSEPIPNKLFVSLAGYRQTRDLSPDTSGNITYLEVKGIESAIRFQATDRLSSGANLSSINARFSNISYPSGFFSPVGFVADNATVFADGNSLTRATAPGSISAPAIPKYSANAFIDYRLPSGLGAELSGWWTSSWYTNIARTVKVPNEHNLNLTLYYRQPKWDGAIRFLNITNQKNYVTGLTGGTSEFITPTAPFAIQATYAYRF
jgi:hypothetical protein